MSWGQLVPIVTHWKRLGESTTQTIEGKLTDMIGNGQLDGETEESTVVAYGKIGNVSVDELNGETSVDRGVGGGHGWGEGAWIVGTGPSVRRAQACVGGGWLDPEEGLLTLGDVAGDGESVENERKKNEGAYLPLECHDGGGYVVLEGRENGLGHLTTSKSQEHPSVLAVTLPVRFPSYQKFLSSGLRRASKHSRAHSGTIRN